mmetsp:Transcript_6068/g.9416  ORF Transcript_6068/g.9416 Transcript_6068/m.9416 type:complete len:361 (-) Transcript_6068:373-1455(-)|eukprot:CAMPEP_0175101322 /NCGR_PEP_ID=MMETSP0086_2-20121207/7723_1 /TAXON_ID=136419 /ORGANISM="Unknown Unknown, Strain D1" /LENGTH=360 /DNA_ID=CAMNT_0016375821 /DNA_START=34 /DNA_END=1116 /DNA_ORIENTATION=-
MVLWVDKYRPNTLEKLDFHPNTTQLLKKLLASGDFPHLMMYGPSGAGKSTRISALLRALYGPGVEKVKATHKSFKIKTRTIEITTMSSNYHIEMNPSDVGSQDRYVIQEVISEIAGTQNVGLAAAKPEADGGGKPSFKVVVLKEADRLSKAAQHALRRTMEKYMSSCRIVLCCESACGIIGAVRSRTLPIRIGAPTNQEVVQSLHQIANKEGLTLPDALAVKISLKCNRNIRRAILMLEASKVQQYPFTADQAVRMQDWEMFIDQLGRVICEEQTPARLQLARNKMYELLANCIPPTVILKTLTSVLLRRLDDQIKHQVVRWSAFYEHRMQTGSKHIFHLEAFVAKFMSIYKRWVVETFG